MHKQHPTPIELTTASSYVADEEQFYFTQADAEVETKEHILQRKKPSQKIGNRMGTESGAILNEAKYQRVLTTTFSINAIKANAQIRVEQEIDLVLKNLKLKKTWPIR